MSNYQLGVITVNYENYSVTEEFLDSIDEQADKDFRVFVCDLSDNKIKLKERDYLTVINGKNKGYAHGLNLGLKAAIEAGLLNFVAINNDMIVESDFVGSVKKSLADGKNELIGGKIYYHPGFEFHQNSYNKNQLGKVIWYAGGEIDWDHGTVRHRGVDEVDSEQFENREPTDFVTGALMCFDKSVVDKVGLWDEEYFMYYEDVDWCVRAKKLGIELIYDPKIVAWHKNAQSTGGSGSEKHVKWQKKSLIRFGLKYAPLRTKIHLLLNYFLR